VLSPAVYQGLIITPGGFHSRELYAFKAETGVLEWAIDIDDDGPSAPACDDGVCVINTESCTLFAVEASTGKLLWSWFLGDPLMSSPAIAGGLVFSAYPAMGQATNDKGAPRTAPPGQTHALAAFELKTGKLVWQHWIDADVMSAPVAVGHDLYATSFNGTVYRFDQKTGAIASARSARATSAPVVVDGQVFFSQRAEGDGEAEEMLVSQDEKSQKMRYTAERRRANWLSNEVQSASAHASKGKQLDAANGFGGGAPASANTAVAARLIGQSSVSTLQSYQGSRVLNYRGANVSTMGDEVVATDARTGERRWSYKLDGDAAKSGGHLAAPPLAAGDRVLVATLEGEVQVVDPKTGKVVHRYQVGGPIRSQPVVANGWIYVGTEDGKLVGIDTGDRTLDGWPMWGRNAARVGAY
jgi:Ca-activated chloride channel homolog